MIGMQPEILPPHRKSPGHFAWLGELNWGHGMIGKVTVAAVVLLALLGVVATRIPSENGMLIIAGIGVFAFFGLLGFLGWFANRHPDLAATEGPTYVQSRQLTLGAKHLTGPPSAELVPDPQNPTLFKPAGAE
jgi:hypothetical protein